jgi:hypothetical protein
MKLTRERKVYGLLLGFGCLALVGDRLLGGPSAAMATVTPERERAHADASVVPPDSKPARVAIGERLAQIMAASLEGDGRDAFQIDPSWRSILEPPERTTSEVAPIEPRIDAALPGVTLPRVTMIMHNGAGGCAMIDGKLVQIGAQTAGGATLLGIDQRAVRLLISGVEVEIPVAASGSPDVR